MLWRCKIVGTLQDAWHVERCLKRFTTLSTNDRVIIFGVGGGERGGGGEVGGNFCAACDTLLMLCSELFPVTFWAGLDAMLWIFSCNSSKMAHLEAVVTLQGSWHVARCLARCKMLETFHNIVDDWPCDHVWGGGWGEGGCMGMTGWETFVRHRHMQLVSACDTLLMLCSELFPITFWAGLNVAR